ncbi:hypothetical protein MEQU1_001356 [Malassezia equina]|uniref:Anaphase-promoting complex subunit 4 n=1 Tax=Malassezia equina TaxID=1381935 RepID=A0AAF0EH96_9BASI|nr:hypothetical protein MEQU1_001356 [Malassezia equina]
MQVRLPHDTHWVGSACNPCMDLVAFLCCDRAPPAAANAPPGLTPAQLAMRQRMLAIQARRMGVANPAAATGAQQVRCGPALKLVVWRMVQAPSCVWDVTIKPPRIGLPRDAAEGVTVLGLCWSPDAVRLGLTHTAGEHTQHALALLVYSVYDGAVLHTHHTLCDHAVHASAMQWIAIEAPSVPSQALHMLEKMPPLAPLPSVLDDKAGYIGAAQHRAKPSEPLPSQGVLKGTGTLAHIPSLSKTDPASSLSLLVCADDRGCLAVWLDGTVPLHAPQLPPDWDVLSMAASPHDASALLAHGADVQVHHLPLAWDEGHVHLARLSTAVRACLAHAMDAASLATQAWQRLVRPRCDEWRAHWEDTATRHGVDLVHEWMALVVGGRASPACEHLLVHLTEGTTMAMETDAKRGLKHMRRLAATAMLPACERLLVLLTELLGCARWPTRFPGIDEARVQALQCEVQTCHAVTLSLQEHSERELLALDEFYKWFRMEQDRQERLKLGEEAPRVVTYHDTLTVLEYLQRGFFSPALDALLGPGASAPPPAADLSDDSHAARAPLWDTASVAYETETPAQDADALAAVEAALAWLDRPLAPPAPSETQWQGVHGPASLLAGPAHAYVPPTLPGDAATLLSRLERVSDMLGELLRDALAQARPMTVQTHGGLSLPDGVLVRDLTVRSIPRPAPLSIAEGQARPLVRAAAHDGQHVHTWMSEAHVVSVHVAVGTTPSVVAPVLLPVPARVHDVALVRGHLHVLYDEGTSTAVGSLGPTQAPMWPPTDTASLAPDAQSLAVFAHGTRVVLGKDQRTVTVLGLS